jgi:hypothetical protein
VHELLKAKESSLLLGRLASGLLELFLEIPLSLISIGWRSGCVFTVSFLP